MIWGLLKQNRWFLLAVVIAAFALRALLFIAFTRHERHAWIYFDSDQYVGIARHIAHGDGICLNTGQPQTYRLPGYPLFVALGYKLFGMREEPMLWVQLVLASFIPILVFMLSGVLFPTMAWVARGAAVVTAIHPGFVLYAGMLATESLFLIFFILFLLLFCIDLSRPASSTWLLLGAGLALGLASMVRPVGHYVLALALVLVAILVPSWRLKIKKGSLVTVGWLVAVAPWLLRNALLTGAICFHTLPGLHFLQYTAANAIVLHDGCSYVSARGRLLGEWDSAVSTQERALARPLNDHERSVIGQRIARTYILRYPVAAMRYSCIQLLKTMAALYASQLLIADTNVWPDYGNDVGWWARIKRFLMPEVNHRWLIVLVYYEIILFLLIMVGVLACWWRCRRDALLRRAAGFVLPFALLLWLLTVAYGCARLRLPLEPVLILCSVYGWYTLVFERLQRARMVRYAGRSSCLSAIALASAEVRAKRVYRRTGLLRQGSAQDLRRVFAVEAPWPELVEGSPRAGLEVV
jgi:4-amino-4-deoxy-L-arabinose transferase-like glycosyltransferase